MSRLTRAANHLTVEQVKEKLKEAKDVVQYKRWLIVYNALIAPRRASEIAELLAVSRDSVHQMIGRYNREGPQALETQRAGGRYHSTLSLSEEQAFLAPFFERAQTGELATIQEIHQALEAHVGKSVHETTIYRLLDRHGWRKLMPRSRHPKADPQTQEMLGSAWNAPSRSSTSHSPGGVCFCGSCSSTGQNRGAPASLRRYGHDEPVSPTGIPGICGCLHQYAGRSSELASLF